MVLTFKQVYSGDTIILSCDNSIGKVKWFFNKVEDQNQANKTWSIRAVSAKNSGSYQCENNGQKSDNFNITVQGKYTTPTPECLSLMDISFQLSGIKCG